ncbi:non-structural maintenance of chromosomes element 1 homolog [Thrips palmi]|uniref:Non-structural maintenance of chromosomes element 1 homolog n=1 Tax=Thrips palmi TaxID=161013 RepID=A0A6P9AEV6_THRPL|nr:non-structural maintenance of chromosomes element 1 homolog [Thrips palmi]XP_034256852.1 non-structural maintenance of chromosomes element 1 homolog [Thrips palmi]
MANAMYNDLHRTFLQAMMSRAIISKTTACALLAQTSKLCGYQLPGDKAKDNELIEIVDEINAKISDFGQQLLLIKAESNSEEFLVFINLIDDSATMEKIDHVYSVKEREVFRLLLENIVRNENYGTLSSMEALNCIPNMRAGDVQDIIDKLVADQWFVETNDGRLVPAPRCIGEFDLYFKRNFQDYVQKCTCDTVVFYGVKCRHCNAINHRHCYVAFNKRRNGQPDKCPSCQEVVDPAAAAENGGGDETPTRQRKKGKRQARRSVSPAVENGHAAEEEEEPTPGPSRGRKRRGVKKE